MAGDFNKPVNTDAYATLLQFIRENIAELAKGLDASTAANIPSGAIRFNSTTKRWEKWNGSAWSELVAKASASYDIRTTQADDIVVGASTAKALGQVGPAANSNGVSNANSYLTAGTWFIANADATTNWPEAGLGGFLQVVTNSAGAYVRQTFFIHNANRMYSRYSTNSGSTWSAWKHVTANADWNAASGADGFIANKPTLGTAAALNAQSTLLDYTADRLMKVGAFGFGSELMPTYSGDLNDIAVTSFYYSATATNDPGGNGHILTVARGAYRSQLWFRAVGLDMAVRNCNNGVWGPWRKVFHAENLLGTVSQSGGVPTGAVIERGSNANGEYVRFADGTQICHMDGIDANYAATADGPIYRSNNVTLWTFPAAFATTANLIGSASAQTSGTRWFNCRIINTASAEIIRFSTVVDNNARTFRAFAIGRWF